MLLYNLLASIESSIALIIPKSEITGDNKENIASIKYAIKNPLIIPYTNPPDLLNILIIGKFAISSAANLINNNKNLDTINNKKNVPTL